MAFEAGQIYGDGTNSSILGASTDQLSPFHYYKVALTDLKKDQYFGQLADVRSMPKNMGKTIKQYHFIPLLDDRNVNSQGIDPSGAVIANGNLYGSSKDIGTISAKLPALSESGGRVNRVGYKRIQLEGTIEKFGFFDEYTQESVDFDSDSQLRMHITRESLRGANELTEDALQIDLLNGAGVNYYGGIAVSDAQITGSDEAVAAGTESVLTYELLMKLAIELDNNHTPKSTKLITGSRLIDTRTIDNARYMYIGSELLPTIYRMKDLHNNPAFVSAQQYGGATTIARGEIGSIGQFRLILVPEMQYWMAGGQIVNGITVKDTAGTYRLTGSEYTPTTVNHIDTTASQTIAEGDIVFVGTASGGGTAGHFYQATAAGVGAGLNLITMDYSIVANWIDLGAAARYDIFPALTVGSGSFTTIGFQTDGKTVKFKITHKAPGEGIADRNDPYGETGFYSIKWYYGTMILRPEWISLTKVIAEI